MKIMHLSDLHIGKRVNEFSMIEDQRYILSQILAITDAERPEAVIIAGDIYDKPLPSAESVVLFDDFVCSLASRELEVMIISGNHDSAERMSFGSRLMNRSGIHISNVYNGSVQRVVLDRDGLGPLNFYLLPFIKPAHVRAAFPDAEIQTYTDAVRKAVSEMKIDESERNILVTHQFVTGASRSESEEISVGGSDNVDACVFEAFDYTALGHLHGPQDAGSSRIRYSGSPLKYSFSEKDQIKSVTMVEMGKKGDVSVSTVPLTPMHDLREIRGTYDELTDRRNYAGTAADDYLRVVLTDEEDIPDALAKLRTIYPNIMKLEYDNTRTRTSPDLRELEERQAESPYDLIARLYELQNGRTMDEDQSQLAHKLIEDIWEAGS